MCEKCDLKNYEPLWIYEDIPVEETKTIDDYCVCNEIANRINLVYYTNKHFWELRSSEGDIEIHYCPFCGRKLEEEE